MKLCFSLYLRTTRQSGLLCNKGARHWSCFDFNQVSYILKSMAQPQHPNLMFDWTQSNNVFTELHNSDKLTIWITKKNFSSNIDKWTLSFWWIITELNYHLPYNLLEKQVELSIKSTGQRSFFYVNSIFLSRCRLSVTN